ASFKAAYKKAGKKLDMGKACLRFKSMDDLVVPAVAAEIKSMPMKKYVENYRQALPMSSLDRKSTRLNSSHVSISYAFFCLKKKRPYEEAFPTSPGHLYHLTPPFYRSALNLPAKSTKS